MDRVCAGVVADQWGETVPESGTNARNLVAYEPKPPTPLWARRGRPIAFDIDHARYEVRHFATLREFAMR